MYAGGVQDGYVEGVSGCWRPGGGVRRHLGVGEARGRLGKTGDPERQGAWVEEGPDKDWCAGC
jgi:hypothetical protein